MNLERISDMVYANTEGTTGGNVGVIVLDEEALAVDSQYPVSGADFRASIPSVTDKPVTHLLLTHVHGDHVLGSQAFEDCNIVSHIELKSKMEKSLRNEWAPGKLEDLIEEIKATRPERAHLYEGLRIVLPTTTFKRSWRHGRVEMTHTGGHTDCSSIVYVRGDRTLLAGDLLFVGRFPWAGDPTVDPDAWIRALQRILEMDVESIVPGHGPMCDLEEVERQLKWFKAVRGEVKDLIEDGVSEDDVVSRRYEELYPVERPEWRENSLRAWYRHWKA